MPVPLTLALQWEGTNTGLDYRNGLLDGQLEMETGNGKWKWKTETVKT